MDFEQYLKKNCLSVREFSRLYGLDYYTLVRVKNGTITRNRSIQKVFNTLGIENERPKRVDTDMEGVFNIIRFRLLHLNSSKKWNYHP